MKTLFVSFVMGAVCLGYASAQSPTQVTSVSGESWISHLHRPLEETSMGKTGLLGPATLMPEPVNAKQGSARNVLEDAKQSVTLRGADLYRLNCQGCHGELGLGAPPEINSVIGATQATSAQLIMDRMKQRGLDTSRAQAMELANQAKGTVLERLHKGGVDMPPFPHLSEPEVRAIFGYLRQLAEIPGAATQQVRVEESPLRVGEHIVKSTCHTCHSAAGLNPTAAELMAGAIPPLSTLTSRVNLAGFEQKVRHGAPIMMGTPVLPYRGRMPVFSYLSESELADAYLYLKVYPPTAWTEPVMPSNRAQLASATAPITSSHEPPSGPPAGGAPALEPASARTASIVPVMAGIFVAMLILGGAIFTVYDVKRSKPRAARFLGIGVGGLVIVPRGTSALAGRASPEAHTLAAWRSRLPRNEHEVFESSWFARHLEKEDGAA